MTKQENKIASELDVTNANPDVSCLEQDNTRLNDLDMFHRYNSGVLDYEWYEASSMAAMSDVKIDFEEWLEEMYDSNMPRIPYLTLVTTKGE